MAKLLWKRDFSNEQGRLASETFVRIVEELMSQQKNRTIFDLKLIYIKELDIPIKTNELYFGFTRKGWEFSKDDLIAELENYCKKNVVEVYFRNDV